VDRVVLIIGAVTIAAVVAFMIDRRRPARPTNPTATVPHQLDRGDFSRPEAPWLVAVFTSATCNSCAGVLERAGHLDSPDVAVQELEVSRDAFLHDRYGIDTVPTLVVADTEGVVRRWFLGPVTSAVLWSALAELREAAPS
jgi:hypothetical protein